MLSWDFRKGQDCDLFNSRWITRSVKLIAKSDIVASLYGRPQRFTDMPRNEVELQAAYLESRLEWWPGSNFDRMLSRLKSRRQRGNFAVDEADFLDELGIPYPALIYLNEKKMSANDYLVGHKFCGFMAESAKRDELCIRARICKMEGMPVDFEIPGRMPVPPEILVIDPRFVDLEHLRWAIPASCKPVLLETESGTLEVTPENFEELIGMSLPWPPQ